MVNIYILQLGHENYYIGKTNQPFDGKNQSYFWNDSCEWLNKYPPVSVLDVFENCDDYDVDKTTLKMMSLHGVEHVRGGSFIDVELSDDQIQMICRMIETAEHKCFLCRSAYHISEHCDVVMIHDQPEHHPSISDMLAQFSQKTALMFSFLSSSFSSDKLRLYIEGLKTYSFPSFRRKKKMICMLCQSSEHCTNEHPKR
jgi:hypothetical protein